MAAGDTFGGNKGKQGFFGKMFDPDKEQRSGLDMSRREMQALRKSLDGLAKTVKNSKVQSVKEELANKKRSAALGNKDPAKALDALYLQLSDVSAKNQKDSAGAWNRAKMLIGKQVAQQGKGKDLTDKQKEQ